MRILGRIIGTRRQLSCHQVAEMLQSYLDDELGDDAAHKVAAHLDDCRRCGLEAETYEALRQSLHRGPSALADEPVARLREFGERLAQGDVDLDEHPAP